ncbi:MAG: amino acid adenylation domain-containing protein [Rhodothermia bacterium]|nr:amino acid adenylation domain-containing protein [Rhodothermia bacterium]
MSHLLHDVVTRSAERLPDKDAFRCNGDSLTYAELAQRSDAVANVLSRMGVRTGDRVGVLMHKSLRCTASVFGIMKAGAAYVSINPQGTAYATAQIVADCDMRAVVCDTGTERLLGKALEKLNCVDFLIGPEDFVSGNRPQVTWPEIESESDQGTRANIATDDLAYIIYTSGSTGKPKGIMHTHQSAVTYASAAAEQYGLVAGDRLSNHSPLHFDMSTFDYFAGPSRGATTVIIPESYMLLPASLSQLIETERLTIWYSVPFALIQLLLRGGIEERDLSSLRWVLFGGEPFPVKHLSRLMEVIPNARFGNVYGPAEVNQCTHYTVPPVREWAESRFEMSGIPIGETWPAATAIVVDEQDRPVPDGEVGELVVSTRTMMKGYWNEPDLTAASMLAVVGAGGKQQTYYRTGDIVQKDSRNGMTFIGRRDRQVKIRGFRVELDAIEACLLAHDSVTESAVVTQTDDGGSRSLVAFLLLRDSASVVDLKRHVSAHLPGYAVPTRFEILDDFPRTTTGKINRIALAENLSSQAVGSA